MKTILVIPTPTTTNAKKDKVPFDIVSSTSIGQGLADHYNVAIMVPSAELVKDIPGWMPSFVPVIAEFPKHFNANGFAYSNEVIKVLTPPVTPVPYDAIFSFSPPSAIGMKAILTAGTFSVIDIPIVSQIDNGASVDRYSDHPQGSKLRAKYAEILEAYSPLAGATTVECEAALSVMKQNMKKLLSHSQVKECCKRLHVIERPERQVTKPMHHKWKKSDPFIVMIAGGFGPEFEGIPQQATATVEAVSKLAAMGKNVKLVVCSTSPDTEWGEDLVGSLGKFGEFYHNPPNYPELFASANVMVVARPLIDCRFSVLFESMMAGKPIIWHRSKYSAGMVDPEYFPVGIPKLNNDMVLSGIVATMRDYPRFAQLALDGAADVCDTKSPKTFGRRISEVIDPLIADSEFAFNKSKHESWQPVFEKLSGGKSFDAIYQSIAKKHTVHRYPRVWVAKMIDRFSSCEVISNDGQLTVERK